MTDIKHVGGDPPSPSVQRYIHGTESERRAWNDGYDQAMQDSRLMTSKCAKLHYLLHRRTVQFKFFALVSCTLLVITLGLLAL